MVDRDGTVKQLANSEPETASDLLHQQYSAIVEKLERSERAWALFILLQPESEEVKFENELLNRVRATLVALEDVGIHFWCPWIGSIPEYEATALLSAVHAVQQQEQEAINKKL